MTMLMMPSTNFKKISPPNYLAALASYRLNGETYSVLLHLIGQLSFSDWTDITQTEIGVALGLSQSRVSSAIKVLVKHQIIIALSEQGPGKSGKYLLNDDVNYYKTDVGRATKGGFRVLEGGKSNPKPKSTDVPPTVDPT